VNIRRDIKMKILTTIRTKLLNAGPKAQLDIIRILSDEYKDIKIDTAVKTGKNMSWKLKRMALILKSVFYKGVIIIQHPITQSKLIRLLPKDRTIFLVHDLNSIRFPDAKNNNNEISTLKKFKYIIIHNEQMKKFLIEKGIDEENLYVLNLFDYVCENTEDYTSQTNEGHKIIFAGNLAQDKSAFLYQLEAEKMKFQLYIYGQGLGDINNKKIIYKGTFQPELLPNEWSNKGIGLVWDGNFDETEDDLGMKNYNKYNNPHKLSCYLAAGIPVIVWEKAAIADIVIENNIGYLINNIYDINKIDFSDYEIKKENAKKIREKVISGYFTKKVINEILVDIEKNSK